MTSLFTKILLANFNKRYQIAYVVEDDFERVIFEVDLNGVLALG